MPVFHSLWNPYGLLERHPGFTSREISWLREETPSDELKETQSEQVDLVVSAF